MCQRNVDYPNVLANGFNVMPDTEELVTVRRHRGRNWDSNSKFGIRQLYAGSESSFFLPDP